jgi:hypothetical protein
VQQSISESSFTETADSLTLEVVHSKVNQGEIATLSKVPIMWTLDNRVKYTLLLNERPWKLKVDGIKLLPFPEGLKMYKQYKASQIGQKADCSSKADLIAEAQCDRKALYKWYAAQYKTEFKKSDYLNFEKHPEHKLGRILIGMYGSTAKYYAINTKSGAWEKIIYSLVTIPPVQIDYFTLQSTSAKYKEVDMAMISSPVFEGTYGDLDLSEFQGLNFENKNRAEFTKADFEKQRGQAESFARSGINFGAMVAKGKDPTIQGGTAEYILKFASPCTPKDKGDNKDPTSTSACKDDKGRVYWH